VPVREKQTLSRTTLGLALVGLSLAAWVAGPRVFAFGKPVVPGATTGPKTFAPDDDSERQVTVFAILATPGPRTIDPRLGSIKRQLRKVLPDHGFKLITVESKRIETGQSITCELGSGYKARTMLVQSLDENGKVRLRCTLARNDKDEFSTLVKTPANQLFFYERSLKDGTRVVIGVGAR